jgi:hypothetical protein
MMSKLIKMFILNDRANSHRETRSSPILCFLGIYLFEYLTGFLVKVLKVKEVLFINGITLKTIIVLKVIKRKYFPLRILSDQVVTNFEWIVTKGIKSGAIGDY